MPQSGVARGQRGAKAHPGGMAQGSGTPPGMAVSGRRGPVKGGKAAIRPTA